MTIQEVIDELKLEWNVFIEMIDLTTAENNPEFKQVRDANMMAIRSLEAWDKVRTEIETEANAIPYGREYYLDKKIEGLEMALEIIDKHLKAIGG